VDDPRGRRVQVVHARLADLIEQEVVERDRLFRRRRSSHASRRARDGGVRWLDHLDAEGSIRRERAERGERVASYFPPLSSPSFSFPLLYASYGSPADISIKVSHSLTYSPKALQRHGFLCERLAAF
jgi:hypothetical protein